ncbi:hypothetical protein ACK3TF_000838 [Chlorella vulgaris]
MPSPSDFRRAFNLSEGAHLGLQKQWEIETVHMGHEAVQQNERYEFPTTLIVQFRAGTKAVGSKGLSQRKQQLEKAFNQATQLEHIVYSAYGSPYECTYGPPQVAGIDAGGRSFKLTAVGMAVRRRDIPTLAAQLDAEQKAKGLGQEAVSAAGRAQFLRRYRVTKSRWSSGRCETCHQAIAPGSQIAKADGQEARGHWSHAACIVRRLKGEEQQEQQQQSDGSGEEPKQRSLQARISGSAASGRKRSRSADSKAEPAGVADGVRGVVTRRRAASAQ